jgi:hypothetical protein
MVRTEGLTAPEADRPAHLKFDIVHPDTPIDSEDGRTVRGRLQRRAIAAGHLAPRPGVRHQLVVTELGRAVLGVVRVRQYRGRPERVLRDRAGDDRIRQAVTEATSAAIMAAVVRIREEEAAALAA